MPTQPTPTTSPPTNTQKRGIIMKYLNGMGILLMLVFLGGLSTGYISIGEPDQISLSQEVAQAQQFPQVIAPELIWMPFAAQHDPNKPQGKRWLLTWYPTGDFSIPGQDMLSLSTWWENYYEKKGGKKKYIDGKIRITFYREDPEYPSGIFVCNLRTSKYKSLKIGGKRVKVKVAPCSGTFEKWSETNGVTGFEKSIDHRINQQGNNIDLEDVSETGIVDNGEQESVLDLEGSPYAVPQTKKKPVSHSAHYGRIIAEEFDRSRRVR